jgi:hypothetical protein
MKHHLTNVHQTISYILWKNSTQAKWNAMQIIYRYKDPIMKMVNKK